MKKIFKSILIVFIGVFSWIGSAQEGQEAQELQEASVESSVFGIQISPIGAWIHGEIKLNQTLALRTELGMAGMVWENVPKTETQYAFYPAITLEPRWYYNLNRREIKGKRIDGNTGNFLTVKIQYDPDWFSINNDDMDGKVVANLGFMPTWGIRRTLGKYFNYEAGVGAGYRHHYHYDMPGTLAVNIHLRFGVGFKGS